ncbi:MAG: hypothetical protein ACTS73_01575 [Arsenophonus sp. NEOnobi-MAG3]
MVAVFISIQVILYQLLVFITPAVYKHER